ncbi:MAG: hypothetical protein J3K34DRAFT_401748 [Monoraphidium minutum]|nr:MAG: hypothetical protein J3K34DRAFT_401748 [Monoraphidium minutum]
MHGARQGEGGAVGGRGCVLMLGGQRGRRVVSFGGAAQRRAGRTDEGRASRQPVRSRRTTARLTRRRVGAPGRPHARRLRLLHGARLGALVWCGLLTLAAAGRALGGSGAALVGSRGAKVARGCYDPRRQQAAEGRGSAERLRDHHVFVYEAKSTGRML